MTAKLKTYVASKRKAWQHWPWDDWAFIETTAQEMNIPQHEVIFALKTFVTADATRKLEFRNFLKSKYPDKAVKKGVPASTNRFLRSLTVCAKCGVSGSDMWLKGHAKHCEAPIQKTLQVIEVEL